MFADYIKCECGHVYPVMGVYGVKCPKCGTEAPLFSTAHPFGPTGKPDLPVRDLKSKANRLV
jgi:hypothetical protein